MGCVFLWLKSMIMKASWYSCLVQGFVMVALVQALYTLLLERVSNATVPVSSATVPSY